MTALVLLIVGGLVLAFLLVALGSYLVSRELLSQERETLEVRKRAIDTKRQLDADALQAARDIHDAIRRHGGQR